MVSLDNTEGPIPGPSSIPIYLINGVGTVWDAQTAATLHCEHGISGLRVGTLPGVSQQNGFLGLPITLMQEETAFLVRQGIAHLVPVSTNPIPPAPEVIAQRTAERIARIQLADKALQENTERLAKAGERAFEKGGEAARAKREARVRAKAEAKARARGAAGETGEGGEGFDLGGENENGKPEEGAVATKVEAGLAGASTPDETTKSLSVKTSSQESKEVDRERSHESDQNASGSSATPVPAVKRHQPPPQSNHFHAVPTFPTDVIPQSSSASSSTPSSTSDLSLPYLSPITSIPHRLFPFPSTPRDNALLGVFTTLSSLSYRMGLGPRFGGEYLVYPGDYLRYHAHFTSQVIVRDEPVKPTELVAWGRLGTGTKKAGLLCCWDDGVREDVSLGKVSLVEEEGKEMDALTEGEEKVGKVEFYSLEWANFG